MHVHVHYFKNERRLPSVIITVGEALECYLPMGTLSSYEVEISYGEVYATGYTRCRDEVYSWIPSTRHELEQVEARLIRLFPALRERFWTGFVDSMTTEISERLRLREEWLTKQQEKRDLDGGREAHLSDQETA